MIVVGVNWPAKNFRPLLITAVAEISTTNGIPSVSREKKYSLRQKDVEKVLYEKLALECTVSDGVFHVG